ncbi:MAG: CBS domain-containing protein [Candidatus Micrarchaeota archaeon]|nr:CBS domain-containing protein [Candidatus Micrarchaeota archaeon]
MAKRIHVGMIAERSMVSVAPDTKASAARKLMRDSNISMVPVLDNGRLVGILSDESVNVNGTENEAGALMLKPLFVEKDRSLDYAIKYLISHRLNRVPVVESSIGMICIGIVTASELLKAKKSMQVD